MENTSMKQRLSGVFAPITTPFDASGEVNLAGLRENMARYAKTGLGGYLALGSNGENKSLTGGEKRRVLETVVQNKGPGQVVMAGCIAESTAETVALAKEAERAGADFITLLSPAYFKKQMTDAALHRYFSTVADAARIPCLLYCAPQFTGGITLSVSLVQTLAGHGNIAGMKDSSTGNIDAYLMAVPDTFAVLAGSANFFLSALLSGAVGGVLSLANAFPAYAVRLYGLYASGDYAACFAMNRDMLALNKAVSGQGGVAAVKAAMDFAGYVGGDPRLPLLPLEAGAKAALAQKLAHMGLLETGGLGDA